jgi:hypothetical protein
MSWIWVCVPYDFVCGVSDCSVSVVFLRVVAGCGVTFIEGSCLSCSSVRLFGYFDGLLGFVLPILFGNYLINYSIASFGGGFGIVTCRGKRK